MAAGQRTGLFRSPRPPGAVATAVRPGNHRPVLLNLGFFSEREDFRDLSCGLCELVELMDGGSRRGQDGYEDDPRLIGELIAVRMRHLTDESVGSRQAQFAADGGRALPAFGRVLRWVS